MYRYIHTHIVTANFVLYILFSYILHTFIRKLFTCTTQYIHWRRERGRVLFSHFNQNACSTYRCQTSLVLITNITKVLLLWIPSELSDVALLLIQSLCLHAYLIPILFFSTFLSTSLFLCWGKVLKASMCLRYVIPKTTICSNVVYQSIYMHEKYNWYIYRFHTLLVHFRAIKVLDPNRQIKKSFLSIFFYILIKNWYF